MSVTPAQQRALDLIAKLTDPKALLRLATNARKQGDEIVTSAADRRRFDLVPGEQPGTFEYDVWRSINALEGALTQERRKTTRLARTRQKIARDREAKTVADVILGAKSAGFDMLIARNMDDYLFERVALRHPHRFDDAVIDAARARLREAGLTV